MQAKDEEQNSIEILQAPIIDEHLSELLSARGATEGKRHRIIMVCAPILGLLIGLIPIVLGLPLNTFFMSLVAVIATTVAIGAFRQYEAEVALGKGDYDQVAALLPDAIVWNALMVPFTYFQFIRCTQIMFNLLLSEGRYVEFEALTRFAWGMNERKRITSGMPKNFGIANNLAVSLLCQGRYAEAAAMFEHLRSQAKNKHQQLFILNNLAICQVRSHLYDAAQSTVEEAITLNPGKMSPFLSARFDYTSALVAIHRSQFEKAEALITKAEATTARVRETVVMRALCQAALGKLRLKQERPDESELFYKNALSLLESMSFPAYATLATICTEYAECLEYAGKHEAAELQKERAAKFTHENFVRESTSAQAIAKRLTDRRWIYAGIELCNLSDRQTKRLGRKTR